MIESAYRVGNSFHVSRRLEGKIIEGMGSSAGYAIVPGTIVRTYQGYPIIINDQMDDGNAASAVSAIFGNLRRGIFLGERLTFTVEEFAGMQPGAIVYYGRGRAAATEWDLRGLVGMVSKA